MSLSKIFSPLLNLLLILITIVNVCITVVNIGIIVKHLELRKSFPEPAKLDRANGMIIHPTFGAYPEKVKFYEGMNIMPGQEAEVAIVFKGDLSKKESKK